MCRRITLIILFLFLIASGAFADTFTVTSNADSGPGTLRQALTKAALADSVHVNYIKFNLPDLSVTGRTIILSSQLPDIGYAKPFDGTTNGQKLPAGVYYYIINLNTNCNLLSGSLTIIR